MKKLLCILFASLFLTLTACSKNKTEEITAANGETDLPDQAQSQTQSTPVITQIYNNIWYRENNCDDAVGPDIPAGEYIFLTYSPEETGKYEIYSYDTENERKGSLIKKGEFSVFEKVTLERGQLLTEDNIMICCASDISNKKSDDGSYLNGIYEIGTDMPAGIYTISCFSDKSAGDTDFVIMRDLENTVSSIISREQIIDPVTVNLTDGQYILMFNVFATLQN